MEKSLIVNNQLSSSNEILIEYEHIHNKAIFDSFNEALDEMRPFGLKGYSFPWKIDGTRLSLRGKTLSDVQSLLTVTEKKVVDWASSLVGILLDKEDA